MRGTEIHTENDFFKEFLEKLEVKIQLAEQYQTQGDTRSHREITIEQYRICIGALSDFFKFVPNCDWTIDGVGSCNIPEVHSEMGIDGPYMRDILALRQNIRPIKKVIHNACTFHKNGVGCILGDLKSPLCAAFTEGDVPAEYDEYIMRQLLNIIQYAGGTPENYFKDTNPAKNWKVVILFLQEVKKCALALKI